MRKTRRSVVLPLIAAAVLASLLLVFFGCRLLERKRVQSEAVLELSSRAGEYDPQSIVLRDTNRLEAQALAEKLGAKLRITKDGHFATLTLEEGRTIADVFSDDRYLSELGKLSADWSISMAALEDDPEEIDAATLLESRARRPEYAVSDSYYSAQTWLDYMNMSSVWSVTKGGGVTVAVIDSGIDTDHPEFAGRISQWSYNASEDKIVKDYDDWSLIEDENGHGTAVAGVIGAAMDGSGTVGVAPEVTLLVIKADMNPDGSIRRSSDVVFGLYYAIERDADVVNMSFGGSEDNSLAAALQLAVDSDIICVASAGNDSSAVPHYPAADPNCIGVGALAQDSWELADYSNYGESVDLVARGTTLTTARGGEYKAESGTSLSAPAVAGAVALYLSRNRYTEYRDLREVLLASSFDLGDLGPDFYFGYGAADVSALVLEEKGTITFDYLTDEIDATKQVFVRSHTLQDIPEPERLYAVFDGWYYDDQCTDEFDLYQDRFTQDLTLYAGWANEDDGVPYTYVELADGTIEIRSYTGHRRYIVIPTYIDGKVVSSIGVGAFQNETRLRQVTLPAQLIQIKASAFSGCTNLLNITIPDTVTSIGEKAFKDNVRLSYAAFGSGSGLRTLGDFAFASCVRLKNFTLPAPLSDMNGSAFIGCTGLTAYHVANGNQHFAADGGVLYNAARTMAVAYPAGLAGDYTLPDTVTEVGQYAFAYAPLTAFDAKNAIRLNGGAFSAAKLKTVDLRNVVFIGECAFAKTQLSAVTIPDSVTEMDKNAFSDNILLVSLSLGRGLTIIPEEAFAFCVQLESVTIPNVVTMIKPKAFLNAGLRTLCFEENSRLTSIESRAFAGTRIETLLLPNSVEQIGERAFSGTTKLVSVSFGTDSALTKLGDYAFSNTPSLKSIALPAQLKELGDYAFMESGLNTVELPAELTALGRGAFAECHDLTAIAVEEGNPAYQSVSGVVFTADQKTLVAYPCGADADSYSVPAGVEALYHCSFYGAHRLTEVFLPDSLVEIQTQAFYDCASLQSVMIPNHVTQISRWAFAKDWRLGTIQFQSVAESELRRIGFEAFAYCGIRDFTVPANVSSMAQYAFQGCKNLISVTFAENSRLESLSAYLFVGCDALQTVTFSAGSALTSLQAHAFDGIRSLRSVDFGNAPLTNIDNFAFRSCAALTSFKVPEGVTYLGRYAFYQCSALAEVSLPSTLDYIGRYAFLGSNSAQLYFAGEALPETLQEGWDGGAAGYYLGVQSVNTSGDWRYAQLSGGGVALLAYTGSAKTVDLSALDFGPITNIGSRVFAYSGVEQIVIPETVTVIQNEAFYASALKELRIPASVTFIGNEAFAHTPIEALTFAEGSRLNTIERSAFEGTEQLSSVAIPAGVTSLGSAAFKRSGISSLRFESGISLTEISKEAFAYTNITSLTIPDSVAVIWDNAFRETKALESVSLGAYPDLKIRANAFYLSGLTSLNIPENVTYIGECAFVGLQDLTAYQVAAGNPCYMSADGLLLSKDGRKLIAAPAGRTGSLTVPAGVEVIGIGAFENSRLSAVNFRADANILTIGSRAFFGMDNLTGIIIPASVVSIDYYAFAYCEKLKTVSFAEGNQLTGVYEGVFCGDISLSDIRLPVTVVEISDFAFYGCESLTSFPLAANAELQGIYSYAMAYSGLSGELTLPESVVIIGDHAFMGSQLKAVIVSTIKQDELSIEFGAFEQCMQLETLSLPFIGRTLDDLDCSWIGYCFGAGSFGQQNSVIPDGLKTVIITGNQTKIGPGAFYAVKNIERVILPESINEVYQEAFYDAECQYEIKQPITIPAGERLELCFRHSNFVGEIVFSETVTAIPPLSFEGCSLMTGVVLPSSLNYIGESAFSECHIIKITNHSSLDLQFGSYDHGRIAQTALIIIDAEGGEILREGYYSTPEGFLYDYDSGICRLRAYYGNEDLVTLPSTINGEPYCIFQMDGCRDVVIPGDLGTVSESAFTGSVSLNTVVLQQGITSIEAYAFDNCRNLESVVFPDGITNIGMYAFFNCCGLKSLLLPEGLTGLGYNAFDECSGLEVVLLPASLISLEEGGAFRECSNLKQISLSPDLLEIGSSTFSGCKSLSGITLPESLGSLGSYSFFGCTSLKEIDIPDEIRTIDYATFYGCISLESVSLPIGLMQIKQDAFVGCENLKSVMIPSSVDVSVIGFEEIMKSRIDQQLRITRFMIDAVDTTDDVVQKKLRRYMENYLSMMMCICSVFLRMINTDESEQKRKEIWDYLKRRRPAMFPRIRRNILNLGTNIPTELGRRLGLGGYHLAQKIFKFN